MASFGAKHVAMGGEQDVNLQSASAVNNRLDNVGGNLREGIVFMALGADARAVAKGSQTIVPMLKRTHVCTGSNCKRWHGNHASGTLLFVPFLTIREAADLTGHSTHKIRRLIKAIADQPGHADRSQIEPSADDVERLSAQQVQFTWRVSEELVHRELGDALKSDDSKATTVGESPIMEAVAVLQRALAAQEVVTERLHEQLKAKDAQIEGMQTFMQSLNERLRESNLLMVSLQKQLPSPDSTRGVDATMEDAKRPTKANAAQGKDDAGHRSKWLRSIFGRL